MARSKVKITWHWKLEILPFLNSSIFKIYLLCHFQWELANDCCFFNYRTISKFDQAGFLMSLLVFVWCDFKLGRKLRCGLRKKISSDLCLACRSWPSVLHGANYNSQLQLSNVLAPWSVFILAVVQRSLLALEWLLITDLVGPDHITIICSQTLVSLYTSDSVNQAVQQKARKVQICEIISCTNIYSLYAAVTFLCTTTCIGGSTC